MFCNIRIEFMVKKSLFLQPSHLKSRKNQLKSRVPTRGAGMSMPILSGFEIQDEVKKRIEAFTQVIIFIVAPKSIKKSSVDVCFF